MKINGSSYEDQEDLMEHIFFLLSDGRDKRLREVAEIISEMAWRIHLLEK